MPWSRRFFNNENTDAPVKVWARVDEDDEVVLEDGRVPIRYEDDDDATVYSASPNNVSRSAEDADDSLQFLDDRFTQTRKTSTEVPEQLLGLDHPEPGTIEIHTDGAAIKSSGSKAGPAGLGVVLRSSENYKEISQYIGEASNQVAELAALYVGLNSVNNPSRTVEVFTDSKYARGMLVNEDWEANANQGLVRKLRDRGKEFENLTVEWVEGHSGEPLNERADDLATEAINRYQNG